MSEIFVSERAEQLQSVVVIKLNGNYVSYFPTNVKCYLLIKGQYGWKRGKNEPGPLLVIGTSEGFNTSKIKFKKCFSWLWNKRGLTNKVNDFSDFSSFGLSVKKAEKIWLDREKSWWLSALHIHVEIYIVLYRPVSSLFFMFFSALMFQWNIVVKINYFLPKYLQAFSNCYLSKFCSSSREAVPCL